MRINCFKSKIDNIQLNGKCRLYGNRDKMIYHVMSKYSKLAQREYKNRHDWVRKMIH